MWISFWYFVKMWFAIYFTILLAFANADTCVTPLGRNSECVSLYDCPALVAAFEQRPLPSHVVSFLRQSQCGFEGYVPRVCCGPLPKAQPQTQPTAPPRPQTKPPSRPGSNTVERTYPEDSRVAPGDTCGVDTNGDRIFGGQFTDLDEFPWMALLGYRTKSGSITYQCGGVLINRRYVLTAAHCLTGAVETQVGTLTTVRLGEYDIQTSQDCLDSVCADPPQEIAVHQALPHRGYSDKNKNRKDDIGLIRLAHRAVYNYYVRPICLPSPSTRVDAGTDVYVAGWGKTLNGKNSPVKLKLALPIFDKSKCQSKYQRLGADLNDKQICAGGTFAQDACKGDSGGPLMRWRPQGLWESIAVVSFGNGCGNDGWPGVYTSVAAYRDWIDSTLRASNA